MSSSFAAKIAARYAPFDFSNVPGFPNVVPNMEDWVDYLPIFNTDDEKILAQHLKDFHACMHQLNIYHEDVLMKMFLSSLSGDIRQWYKALPVASISSLKDFHVVFHSYCKIIIPHELLLKDCCEQKFECDQEMEEQVYYNSEDEEDLLVYEETSLDSFDLNAPESFQEGTVLFPILEDKGQDLIEQNDIFVLKEDNQHKEGKIPLLSFTESSNNSKLIHDSFDFQEVSVQEKFKIDDETNAKFCS
jgi:hypothetical protein